MSFERHSVGAVLDHDRRTFGLPTSFRCRGRATSGLQVRRFFVVVRFFK